jgi:hypothetical protein
LFCCIRKKNRAAEGKEKELEVDWDRIEGEFKEMAPPAIPPHQSVEEGSRKSPTSTMVDTTITSAIQVPFSPVDHHQRLRASIYSPSLAPDMNIIKPDYSDKAIENFIPHEKIDTEEKESK